MRDYCSLIGRVITLPMGVNIDARNQVITLVMGVRTPLRRTDFLNMDHCVQHALNKLEEGVAAGYHPDLWKKPGRHKRPLPSGEIIKGISYSTFKTTTGKIASIFNLTYPGPNGCVKRTLYIGKDLTPDSLVYQRTLKRAIVIVDKAVSQHQRRLLRQIHQNALVKEVLGPDGLPYKELNNQT